MTKLKLTFLVLLVLTINSLVAQNASLASGGEANTNMGSVSYSIGQVAYSFSDSESGIVSQGVQQPFEIFKITSIGKDEGFNLECIAYPNPTTQYLNLELNNTVLLSKNISIRLYNSNGELVLNQQITNENTRINTEHFQSGQYVMNVIANNGPAKSLSSFKIIKQ